MSNLLTSPDLVPKHLYLKASSALGSWVASDPMPIQPGARIRTTKGVRDLALDEFCRRLGYLKEESSQVPHQMAMRTTPCSTGSFYLQLCPDALLKMSNQEKIHCLPIQLQSHRLHPQWTPIISLGPLRTSKRKGNGSLNELLT